MPSWLWIVIVVVAVAFMVGNIMILKKTAKRKLPSLKDYEKHAADKHSTAFDDDDWGKPPGSAKASDMDNKP